MVAKLGKSGYLYVMNSKGDLLVHPTAQGSNLADEDFVKTMIANKDKVKSSTERLTYVWQGTNAVAYYTYFQPLDWIIAARVDPADFSGPVDNLRNAIIIILITQHRCGCLHCPALWQLHCPQDGRPCRARPESNGRGLRGSSTGN